VERVSGRRRIAIQASNSELIDGASRPILLGPGSRAVMLVTDGTQWIIFSQR